MTDTAVLTRRRRLLTSVETGVKSVDYGELAMGLFCTGGVICSVYLVGISYLIGGFMGWVLMFMWGFLGFINLTAAVEMFRSAFS